MCVPCMETPDANHGCYFSSTVDLIVFVTGFLLAWNLSIRFAGWIESHMDPLVLVFLHLD